MRFTQNVIPKLINISYITLVILIIVMIPSLDPHAQSGPRLVSRHSKFHAFERLEWSANGDTLSFHDVSEVFNTRWFQYNLTAEQLMEAGDQPLLPPFQADLLPTPDPNYPDLSFVIPSPNGRYLLYKVYPIPGEWEDDRARIALLDNTTRETRTLNLPISDWSAKWSSDSSTVGIDTSTNYGGNAVYYLKIISSSVLEVEVIDLWDMISVTGRPGTLSHMYGVTSNGARVLLGTARWLTVWDYGGSSELQSFADEYIYGAATFTPDDLGVWYLTKTGMFHYDLVTQQTTAIQLESGLELLQNATDGSISPDGKHIAVVVYENATKDYALYILKIAQGQ